MDIMSNEELNSPELDPQTRRHIIQQLIKAKKKIDYQPILFVRWSHGRFAILREPSARESEFYTDLKNNALSVRMVQEEVVRQCMLYPDFDDFNSNKRAGDLVACFDLLTQWTSSGDPKTINPMIIQARQSSSRLVDFALTYVKGVPVNGNLDLAAARNMPMSEILRMVFASERVVQEMSPNARLFEMLTPEMIQERKRKEQQDKTQKILAQARRPDPPMPAPPSEQDLSMLAAHDLTSKIIKAPKGAVPPKYHTSRQFR